MKVFFSANETKNAENISSRPQMPSPASRQSLARHRQVKKIAFQILRVDWFGKPCFLLNMTVTLTETA